MGRSKQLLDIGGVPLLVHSVRIALDSGLQPVTVVLGAHAEEHRQLIQSLPVDVIVHSAWEKGMGSSLKAGLSHLLNQTTPPEAVMVMVCDQPRLTTEHLRSLVTAFEKTKKSIIASHYGGTDGVPALFDKSLFAELLALPDEQGARKVIAANGDVTERIAFPDGALDLDTPEDYNRYKLK